jgi:large subunit ribosomal protein L11
LRAAAVAKGSAEPNKTKVASITRAQLREIAETKMQDLNAVDVEGAMLQIEGSARSMGISIKD